METKPTRFSGPEIDNLRPNGPYTDVTLHVSDEGGFIFYSTKEYDTVTTMSEWERMKIRRHGQTV